MWYGVSNIISRMVSAIITPLLTYLLGDDKSGKEDMGTFFLLYAAIALGNIIYTYGLETGYFRFVNQPNVKEKTLFNTAFTSLLISSTLLSLGIILGKTFFSEILSVSAYPELIIYIALLFWLDTMSALPFARLRQQGRPMFYALVKILGVLANLFFVLLFLYVIPVWMKDVNWSILEWIRAQNRVSLLLIANLLQSLIALVLLFKVYKNFRLNIDLSLWRKVLAYSLPMILIGMAGMINEVLDRFFLRAWLPLNEVDAKAQIGIYGANYKLGIIIALFIQAFKLGAEPFFFNEANKENARENFARIMKWFVITLCIAFLTSALFYEVLALINKGNYQEGKDIVPIILLANVYLGIYYNLSIWYKLTAKMFWGVIITGIGALVTVLICYYYIPIYGIMAPAWATLICYALMTVIAYLVGQKYYPVPYQIKEISLYLFLAVGLFALQQVIKMWWIPEQFGIYYIIFSGIIFLLFFLYIIVKKENIPLALLTEKAIQIKSKFFQKRKHKK